MSRTQRYSVTQGWALLLADMGIRPADVLRQANLPEDLFHRKEASLGQDEYFRLWRAMEVIFGKPTFPLDIANKLSVEVFDPPIFAAFCSPDLNTALHRLSQFKPLIGPVRLHISESEKSTRLEIRFLEPSDDIPASLIGAELAFFVQIARMATRHEVRPLEVLSPIKLPGEKDYTAYFGRKPRKSSELGLVFDAADARRPFLTQNDEMWQVFEPNLRKRLVDLDEGDNFSTRVHSALLELLPSGRSGVDEVASKLLVSKRTLQRKLSSEDTNFQNILNQVREELARHYLTNSSLSSAEISFLLGFDDPNSFFRAFHSWTGTTPESIRTAAIH